MNGKNKLITACLLLFMILGGVGCSKKTVSDVERIQASGNLRVAIVDTDSQYTDSVGEQLVGIEPELAEYIAENLKVQVKYQVCTKKGALDAVAAGEADIALGCINRSSSLTGEYLMSTHYGTGHFYAVTKAGDYTLTIGAFKDSVVGVDKELDEDTRTKLYQAEGIRVSDYSSYEDGARGVNEGSIRAYICYENQAKLLLEDEELQVQNMTNLEPEEFVVVAAKSDVTLIRGINTLIQQFLEKE